MKKIPHVTFWASDFGDIKLPDDFPIHIFRKDGWWDSRYKAVRYKWEKWIAAEERKLIAAPEFALQFTIPNRLHGAAINAEGCAI